MERRRILKRALILAAVLTAAALGALGVYVDRALSAPDLKPRIEKALTEYLGRPVSIEALDWRPRHGVLVGEGVKVYDDEKRTRLIVDAPVIEAHIAPLSVFKLAAGITDLRFVSPRVTLRREPDGSWNVVQIVQQIAARPSAGGASWGTLAFNWFTISSGTVIVQDSVGDFDLVPPLGIDASGKLRIGRHHAHFPFWLDARFFGDPALLRLWGDLGGHSRLHAELERGDAALARPFWPPAAQWRKASWRASLDYDAHASEAWRFAVRGAPVVLSTDVPTIDSVDVSATYLPPSLTFFAVERSSATELEVRGASSGAAIDLDIRSRATDLNTLVRIVREESALASRSERSLAARARARKEPKSHARPARITATVSVDRLLWGSTPLSAVRAAVSRSTGPWTLERLTMRGLGGEIEAKGAYDPAGDGSLALDWTTSGVALQDLFRVAGSSREAAGTLDSEGHIETALGDRFLPAMNGKIQLDLKNGWFGGLPGLLKVMTKLNLSTLFAKAGKHHQARVPFDEAHASLTIASGKMTTDHPLVLRNKTLEIAYMGSLVLATQDVDGKVVVHILSITGEIIKLIPGVRDLLLAGHKSMVPIWVKVSGKADDPVVDVLEGKTISSSLWNPFKRLFRLPKKLWKKLGG